MNGTPLDSVSHRPFLGDELSSNLNWSFHIENIKGKANWSLGFITRNLHSCPENVKSQAYITLVRPCLEYTCNVWHPHKEGVQRPAARFVKNFYELEPGTVTNLLGQVAYNLLKIRELLTFVLEQ